MAANGKLPASDLAVIPGTDRRLRRDLIAQTAALRAAFEARFGKALVITDAYRDYATQERIFRQRYTTTYLPGRPSKVWRGRRWWQKRGTAMAAVPGTSNHGWGQAIDFGSRVNVRGSAEHNWMRQNGPRYGWTWPSWWAQAAGEWWHFEATPVPASNYRPGGGSIPSVPDLTPPDPLGDDMPLSDDDLKKIQAAVHSTPIGRTGKTLAQMIDLIDDLPRDVWYYVDRDRGHSVPRYDAVNDTYLAVKGLVDAVMALPGALARAVWSFKRGGDATRGPDVVDAIQRLDDIGKATTGKTAAEATHPSKRTSPTDF